MQKMGSRRLVSRHRGDDIRKRLVTFMAFMAAMAAAAASARAASISYSLQSLVTQSADTTATYSGSGFASMTSDGFGRYFRYETMANGSAHSKTMMQVDISALAGKSITSATLSYVLGSGNATTADLQVTSFDADGTIEHSFAGAPDPIDTAIHSVNGLGSNSIDLTSLLSDRVSDGESWFGVFLTNLTGGSYHWTFTGMNLDAAQVRLDVEFGDAVVPVKNPTPAAALAGLVGFGLLTVRRPTRTTQPA